MKKYNTKKSLEEKIKEAKERTRKWALGIEVEFPEHKEESKHAKSINL